MRLTLQQRIAALERENIILHDTIKTLHKMLKEHRELINEYITQRVSSDENKLQNETRRPEDVLYTFVCKQRFDHLEKRMERIRKTFVDSQNSDTG